LDRFAAGEFDVVAIGRVLLVDPTWVNRLRRDALTGY
jgi:2,4-dienoyl-CoA reductase-like NADH-dependent reductase (Old Yellow Enzyme family)